MANGTDPAEDIKPPFSDDDLRRIDEILREAQLDPGKGFKRPTTPAWPQPDKWIDPDIEVGRIYENWSSRGGDGVFKRIEFDWQPKCEEPFYIVMAEVWTPPPADLAAKFKTWAAFATVRAVLICRRNDRCRRPQMLGCDSIWDSALRDGRRYGRASFNFQCWEI